MTAEEIRETVKAKVEAALKEAAYEISFEIQAAYDSAIDAFYNSYAPHVYNRNYYTYTGSDSCNDYSRHVKPIDGGIQAGIKVSGDYVDGAYKDPVGYVFNRTYHYGIHGTIRTGGVMTVPPERLMQMSFEGIKANLGKYVDKYINNL